MRVDIVTPERELVSTEAERVQIPGMQGDMTVMAHHAPTVTTLRPGIVQIDGDAEYLTTGGFAEITADGCSILAEGAVPKADASSEYLTALLDAAKAAVDTAADADKTAARQRVNDIGELMKRAL